MHDLLSNELAESTEYLPHDLKHLLFFEFLPLHQFLEIPVFAELGDDVEAVLGAEYVFELDDIGVVESLEQVDL